MNAAVEPEPHARRISLPGRGGEMAALDFGPQDRPVDIVFSHANGFNARTYRTILAPAAERLRILAPDLRGHGATSLPADPQRWPGWRGFAEDLLALLEAEAEGPVVLAGHSLGATSSLLAAGEAPELARALVLFEPVLLEGAPLAEPCWDTPLAQATLRRRDVFPNRAAALAAYRGRGAFAGWSEAALQDYVAAGFHDAPGGGVDLACRPDWEALSYAVHDYEPRRALEAVRAPMRIFAGDVGSTLGPQARTVAARVGRLEVIPGASHFLPMERPDLVRAALEAAAEA